MDRCGSLVLRSGFLLSMTVIETVRRPSYGVQWTESSCLGLLLWILDWDVLHAYGAGMANLL